MNVMTTPKPETSAKVTTGAMMKALVYQGPGKKALEDRRNGVRTFGVTLDPPRDAKRGGVVRR